METSVVVFCKYFVYFLFLLFPLTVFSGNHVPKEPSSVTIWGPDETILINENLVIGFNDTLKIFENTTVVFKKNKKIEVRGVIEAIGLEGNEIIFKGENNNPEDAWNGIIVGNAGGDPQNTFPEQKKSVFRYCNFSNVSNQAIACLNVMYRIDPIVNCRFSNIETKAINIADIDNSDLKIANCHFENISEYCIQIYENQNIDQFEFSQNVMRNNSRGINLQSSNISNIVISDNVIYGPDTNNTFSGETEPYFKFLSNDFLNMVSIYDNSIHNLVGNNISGEQPDIFLIDDLESLTFEGNTIDSVGRLLKVYNCQEFISKNNSLKDSPYPKDYVFSLTSNNSYFENDSVLNINISLNAIGGLYDINHTGHGMIQSINNFYSNINSSIYVLDDFELLNNLLFQGNHFNEIETVKPGGVLRVESNERTGNFSLINSIQITGNLFENLKSYKGGVLYFSVFGEMIDFISENNTYQTIESDIGGSFYFDLNSITALTFNLENIDQSYAIKDETDYGTGGFLYLNTDTISQNLSFNSITSINTNAKRSGGFAYVRINNSFLTNEVNFISNNIENSNSVNGNGGILSLESNAEITDLKISNNTCNNNSEFSSAQNGGGFYINILGDLQNMEITDNSFHNFQAAENGGILSVTIADSTDSFLISSNDMSNNLQQTFIPESGGAIYFQTAYLRENLIKNNQVSGFKSGSSGGGIYINATDQIEVIEISEENNITQIEAGGDGAGIYINTYNNLTNELKIVNNSFSNLYSEGSGTGLYINLNSGNAGEGIELYRNSFTDCSANNNSSSGGGIYLACEEVNKKLNLEETVFEDCIAGLNGGGFYINSEKIENISISGYFEQNIDAIGCKALNGSGGAYYLSSNLEPVKQFLMEDIFIEDNYSNLNAKVYGGGLYLFSNGDMDSTLIFDHNTFGSLTSENSGGAVYVDLNNNHMKNGCIIHYNRAVSCMTTNPGSNGGAFCFNVGDIKDSLIISSNFMDNCQARESGGAFYFSAEDIDQVSVVNNSASDSFKDCTALDGNGGSICIESSGQITHAFRMKNNNFNGNPGTEKQITAGMNGGAIAFTAKQCNSVNINGGNYFSNLACGANGGSVYINIEEGNIENFVLTNNIFSSALSGYESGENGGAFSLITGANINSKVQIENNTFTSIDSEGNGGGIYINNVNSNLIDGIELIDNNFASCKANGSDESKGGGMALITGNIQNSLNIHNNKFSNCISLGDGGAISVEANSLNSTLNLSENFFQNCQASYNGGGTYFSIPEIEEIKISNNHQTLENKGFVNCTAINGSGGSIFLQTGINNIDTITVINNSFTGIQNDLNAGNDGGALYFSIAGNIPGGVLLEDNLFSGLKANNNGGAFVTDMDQNYQINQFKINNNSFENIVSMKSGGGIQVDSGNIEELIIENTIFQSCYCADGNGGAFSFDNYFENIEINNNEFENCYAGSSNNFQNTGKGGSIYLNNLDSENMGNINFTFNKMTESGNGTLNGGGIYSSNFDQLFIDSCIFSDLSAQENGGAIHLYNCRLAEINKTELLNNNAGNDGGAAYLKGFSDENRISLYMDSSFCLNNSAGISGGIIYINESFEIEIKNNQFIQGKTKISDLYYTYGGALYINFNNKATISNNDFIDNICMTDFNGSNNSFGGAIYIYKSYRNDIFENNFIYNSATDGGAIHITDDIKSRMSDNMFDQNFARNGAGIKLMPDDEASPDSLIFNDNIFQRNTVSYRGAAVFSQRDNLHFVRNRFNNNSGDPEIDQTFGSSIYLNSTINSVKLNNCVFFNNFDKSISEPTGTLYLDVTGSDNRLFDRNIFLNNCTFYQNTAESDLPYHPIVNHPDWNVNILNSIFSGCLKNPEDYLFADNSKVMAEFSRLQGNVTDVDTFNILSALPNFNTDERLLIPVNSSEMIDSGNPDIGYNDNYIPIGQATQRNDIGASGGPDNSDDSTYVAFPPEYIFTELKINRLGCSSFEAEFENLQYDFDHFNWYIDGRQYTTDTNYLAFDFNPVKMATLDGIGTSDNTEMILFGNITIEKDKFHIGEPLVTYKSTEYENDQTIDIIYPDCLYDISIAVKLDSLDISYMEVFQYEWDIAATGSDILFYELTVYDEDSANINQVSLDPNATPEDAYIAIEYHAWDECGHDETRLITIKFNPLGFTELMVDNNSYDPENQSIVDILYFEEITFSTNQPAGYLNDNNEYEEFPDTNIKQLELFSLLDDFGDTVELESVFATNNLQATEFIIKPEQLEARKEYYLFSSDRIITRCKWQLVPVDYSIGTIAEGIDDNKLMTIEMSPNPVNEILTVTFNQPLTGKINLLNITGETLKSNSFSNSTKLNIDFCDLMPGTYIIKIEDKYNSWSNIIIKK